MQASTLNMFFFVSQDRLLRQLRKLHKEELRNLLVNKHNRQFVLARQYYEYKLEKLQRFHTNDCDELRYCIHELKLALDDESAYMCESWMKHIIARVRAKL